MRIHQTKKMIQKCLVLFGIICFFCAPSFASQPVKKVAILPFETISGEDISHLQNGAQQMLFSRLRWAGHVDVINQIKVQQLMIDQNLSMQGKKNQNKTILKVADLTGSDYVLTGSIIQFADAFSIDTRVYDIKNKKYLTFFEQSKLIDDIIPKINILSAKINKKVFQRETIVYENLVKQEKEKAEQWKRQNPERMMPVRPKEEEGKAPIWKFWEYL